MVRKDKHCAHNHVLYKYAAEAEIGPECFVLPLSGKFGEETHLKTRLALMYLHIISGEKVRITKF